MLDLRYMLCIYSIHPHFAFSYPENINVSNLGALTTRDFRHSVVCLDDAVARVNSVWNNKKENIYAMIYSVCAMKYIYFIRHHIPPKRL